MQYSQRAIARSVRHRRFSGHTAPRSPAEPGTSGPLQWERTRGISTGNRGLHTGLVMRYGLVPLPTAITIPFISSASSRVCIGQLIDLFALRCLISCSYYTYIEPITTYNTETVLSSDIRLDFHAATSRMKHTFHQSHTPLSSPILPALWWDQRSKMQHRPVVWHL